MSLTHKQTPQCIHGFPSQRQTLITDPLMKDKVMFANGTKVLAHRRAIKEETENHKL